MGSPRGSGSGSARLLPILHFLFDKQGFREDTNKYFQLQGFKKDLFLFSFTCVHVSHGCRSPQRAEDPLELELQVIGETA